MTAAAVRSWPFAGMPRRYRLAEAAKHYSRPVRLPMVGKVRLPPRDRLAYFAGLGVIAALGIVEWPVALVIGADWPVALVIGAGHVLADQHWSGVARGLGEAVEGA
jgi:hypothetical protein